MKRNEIIKKIILIIKSIIGEAYLDEKFALSEDVKLFQNGLGFSSIDSIILVVKLEEIFNIEWPDDFLSFDDIITIGQVADIIAKCLKQKENID